jgi:hypothetical protein
MPGANANTQLPTRFVPGFPGTALLALLALSASFLYAQAGASPVSPSGSPAATREVTTKETPIAFKSGTNLVLVPVVVRDAHDTAVGTLGREDFQLFDNGKPVMISKFSVEKLARETTVHSEGESVVIPTANGALSAPNPEAIPDRFIAYVFDDVHLNPAELNSTREAARRRIDSSVDSLERTAIYAISGAPSQEFTADRDKLHNALDTLGTSHNTVAKLKQATCPAMTYYMGDQIYNKNDTVALNIAANDAVVCGNLYVNGGVGHGPAYGTGGRQGLSSAGR